MIGSGLKKVALNNGMTVENGAAYGYVHGSWISLNDENGYQRLCIYAGYQKQAEIEPAVDADGTPEHLWVAKEIIKIIKERAADYKTYRIIDDKHNLTGGQKIAGVSSRMNGSVIQVCFMANRNASKFVQAFISDILPEIADLTSEELCASCGEKRDGSMRPLLLPDCTVLPVHAACAEALIAANSKNEKKAPPAWPLLGLIGSLLGAIIGAVVWAAIGIFGYIASIAGLLAAFLSSKGYDLLGGKPGKFKVLVLIVCVILSVVLGNLGVVVYEVHTLYAEEVAQLAEWQEAIPESEFMQIYLPLVLGDSDVIDALAKDGLIGLFFAALGCFGIIARATKSAQPKFLMLKGQA